MNMSNRHGCQDPTCPVCEIAQLRETVTHCQAASTRDLLAARDARAEMFAAQMERDYWRNIAISRGKEAGEIHDFLDEKGVNSAYPGERIISRLKRFFEVK